MPGFNKQRFDSLSPDTQEVLRSAAQEAMRYMRTLVANDDQTLVDDLRSQGMQITELTPQQHDAFVQATRGIYDARKATIGADLIERVQQINTAP